MVDVAVVPQKQDGQNKTKQAGEEHSLGYSDKREKRPQQSLNDPVQETSNQIEHFTYPATNANHLLPGELYIANVYHPLKKYIWLASMKAGPSASLITTYVRMCITFLQIIPFLLLGLDEFVLV